MLKLLRNRYNHVLGCKYLGSDTGERAECQGCGKRTQLKVFDCAMLGCCTLDRIGAGVAGCCAGCEFLEVSDSGWVGIRRDDRPGAGGDAGKNN